LTDQQLVSYLDGAASSGERDEIERLVMADAALAARLALLSRGDRHFKKAFRPLLNQAPIEKLQASLASARAKTRNESAFAEPGRYLGIAITASFMAVIVLGGLIAGYFVGTQSAMREPNGNIKPGSATQVRAWPDGLAEYHALLSPKTFALRPIRANERISVLGQAGSNLGLNLTSGRINDPDLEFRSVQVLQLDKMPLVHIAYLTREGIPLSFCIVKSAGPSRPPVIGRHGETKLVHWASGGYGFLLIARIPEADLKTLARRMQRRFL